MTTRQIYSQARDLRWKASAITEDGACLGLALFWLLNQVNNSVGDSTFWNWLGVKSNSNVFGFQGYLPGAEFFLKDHNEIRRVMSSQQKLRAEFGGNNFTERYTAPLIGSAMTNSGKTKLYGKVLSAKKPSVVKTKKLLTAYYYEQQKTFYSMAFMQGPKWAHAVATCYISNGKILFFDPNQGETEHDTLDSEGGFTQDGTMNAVLGMYKDINTIKIVTFVHE